SLPYCAVIIHETIPPDAVSVRAECTIKGDNQMVPDIAYGHVGRGIIDLGRLLNVEVLAKPVLEVVVPRILVGDALCIVIVQYRYTSLVVTSPEARREDRLVSIRIIRLEPHFIREGIARRGQAIQLRGIGDSRLGPGIRCIGAKAPEATFSRRRTG